MNTINLKRKIRVLTVLVLASALLTVFISGCAAKKEEQIITIGVLSDVDSVPFIIAQEEGYLDSNVQITKFNSAQDRDTAFQSKNVDGVISDVLAACLAKTGGFDVVITSQTNGLYKLLVNKDTGVTDIAGMKGMSAAMSKNTIIEYAFDTMMLAGGLSENDVTKEYIPQIPVRLEMLNANQVNSALLPEPFGSSAELSGGVLIKSSADLGINPGVMVFSTEAVKNKADEIKKVYEAYNKAVDYLAAADKSDYIDIVMENLGFPENVRETIVLPNYTKAVLPSEDEVTAANTWLVDKGLIEKPYSFSEITTEEFIK